MWKCDVRMSREMTFVTVFCSYVVLLSVCLRSSIPAVNGGELSAIVSKTCAEYFNGLLKVEWGGKENLSSERYSVAVCTATFWIMCTWGTYCDVFLFRISVLPSFWTMTVIRYSKPEHGVTEAGSAPVLITPVTGPVQCATVCNTLSSEPFKIGLQDLVKRKHAWNKKRSALIRSC